MVQLEGHDESSKVKDRDKLLDAKGAYWPTQVKG